LKFNELVISKSGVSQLIYFWFQGRDRNFTNEYAAKFYWSGTASGAAATTAPSSA